MTENDDNNCNFVDSDMEDYEPPAFRNYSELPEKQSKDELIDLNIGMEPKITSREESNSNVIQTLQKKLEIKQRELREFLLTINYDTNHIGSLEDAKAKILFIKQKANMTVDSISEFMSLAIDGMNALQFEVAGLQEQTVTDSKVKLKFEEAINDLQKQNKSLLTQNHYLQQSKNLESEKSSLVCTANFNNFDQRPKSPERNEKSQDKLKQDNYIESIVNQNTSIKEEIRKLNQKLEQIVDKDPDTSINTDQGFNTKTFFSQFQQFSIFMKRQDDKSVKLQQYLLSKDLTSPQFEQAYNSKQYKTLLQLILKGLNNLIKSFENDQSKPLKNLSQRSQYSSRKSVDHSENRRPKSNRESRVYVNISLEQMKNKSPSFCYKKDASFEYMNALNSHILPSHKQSEELSTERTKQSNEIIDDANQQSKMNRILKLQQKKRETPEFTIVKQEKEETPSTVTHSLQEQLFGIEMKLIKSRDLISKNAITFTNRTSSTNNSRKNLNNQEQPIKNSFTQNPQTVTNTPQKKKPAVLGQYNQRKFKVVRDNQDQQLLTFSEKHHNKTEQSEGTNETHDQVTTKNYFGAQKSGEKVFSYKQSPNKLFKSTLQIKEYKPIGSRIRNNQSIYNESTTTNQTNNNLNSERSNTTKNDLNSYRSVSTQNNTQNPSKLNIAKVGHKKNISVQKQRIPSQLSTSNLAINKSVIHKQ